jgi:methylated-DNA-[protein]-cysteine S-methyltransferase
MERLHHSDTLEKVRRNVIEEVDQYKIIDSPVGPLTLIASEAALSFLGWGSDLPESVKGFCLENKKNSVLTTTESQLREYFVGTRTSFDVPLAPTGTEFQRSVWHQLLKIPYGKSITYGEQARRLGRPKSARAVGAANGKNPIGIIIPCHRVLGASGSLTGFAGGIELKRKLLALEGIQVAKQRSE